jgi:adenylate cyclase
MSEEPNRRLAAILAADVVGYSRLMSEDEAATLDALRHLRRDVFTPAVSEYNGKLVKSMGDGWLVEFPSVADGVACSIQVQEAIADHKRIKLRIGLHVGDVTFEEEDIYGDGVNVASRLQELADPGAIVISAAARSVVDQTISAGFDDLGAHDLKNIPEPIFVYGWGMTEAGKELPTLKLPDKPSIAVLPFDNMSGDPEQEFFADGLTEDLITEISRISDLLVIARNSSFAYKAKSPDIRQVADELDVAYVLEGSVRRSGNRVRLNVQLIEAESNQHVWAERYDRELDDIFALQDEITEAVVGRIDSAVRASEMRRARRQRPANLNAWELYQRGLWQLYKMTKESNREANRLFCEAVERDPEFALAHGGIAYTCFHEVFHDYDDNPAEWLARGIAAGEHAVALDDKDSFAHFALGRVLILAGEFERAVAELEKTVTLNSSFAHGYYGLAQAFNRSGRAEEAISMVEIAMRLSPQDPMLWGMQTILAMANNYLERYTEAEKWARKTVHARPDLFWSHIALAVSLVGQDRLVDARKAVESARNSKPGITLTRIERSIPQWYPEYRDLIFRHLEKAGLPED